MTTKQNLIAINKKKSDRNFKLFTMFIISEEDKFIERHKKIQTKTHDIRTLKRIPF